MFKEIIATGAVALFTLTSTVFGASAAGPISNPNAPGSGVAAQAAIAAAPKTVTPAEAEALQFMREEEKLAHDVYVTLYEQWDLRVFNNISRAEQQHTDAVAYWLEYYDLSDPAAGLEFGEFDNDELQALYDRLVAQGTESVADALKVGAAIEEIDILDLQERQEYTENSALERLFENLERGSENHLRAFVQNLDARTGTEYEPQYMTQADYDEVVSENDAPGAGGGGRRGGRRP
jgi:hypothetical protein